jgi:hypothetical protein
VFEQTLAARSASERARDRAVLLAKRSAWLQPVLPEDIRPTWQSREAGEALVRALNGPSLDPAALRTVFERTLFDHERVSAIERFLERASRRRDLDVTRAAFDEALELCEQIAILGHRAQALGACAQTAVTLGDPLRLARVCDRVATMVRRPNETLSLRDLLRAATPAVRGAVRLGTLDEQSDLIAELDAVANVTSRDAMRVRALLAEAALARGRDDEALRELDSLVNSALGGGLDFNGAYEVIASVVEVLSLVSLPQRGARLLALAERVTAMGDNFVTRRFYGTYELLTFESLVRAAIAATPAQRTFVEASVRSSRSFG